MVKLFWTDQAKLDLREIHEYISHQSILQANKVTEKITNEIQTIPFNPTKGRTIVSTPEGPVRQMLVFKYKIFYWQLKDDIEILSIYHSARLLSNNPGLQNFFDQE